MRALMLLITLIMAQTSLANETDISSQLSADGGHLRLHTFYSLLDQYGIQVIDPVKSREQDWESNPYISAIKSTGGLQLSAPYGGLKAVTDGQLYLDADFSWQLPDGKLIDFKNLQVVPTTRPLRSGDLTVLDVLNQNGEVIFIFDHIHAGFNADFTQLFMENMDLRISPWLAAKMNLPELKNHVVGQANMYVNLSIPASYHPKTNTLGGCSTTGNWPPGNPDVDVALIEMDEVSYLGDVDDDHIIVTPSATLQNVGTANVAWYRKFTGQYPPYNNDQHPYLVWNLYREIDNRFEQVGASGVKHAFFTVNTNCGCDGGQILFPTCQDKYSVSNNHAPTHIGPRSGINAFSGIWQSTGSFFDQDGNGVQDNSSNGVGENRMVVAEADISDNQINHYLSAWYLIRDDINIFNNMGHKQYNFMPVGDAWSVSALTNFTSGPASDQYVVPDTIDLQNGTASERVLQANEGHITVAVKVIELGHDLYRYNYMIENHDYDPQIQSISLPLNGAQTLLDVVFSDVDEDALNDWSVSRQNDTLSLQAPVDNELDWGYLYSFSFTSDAPPGLGDVTLTGLENGNSTFTSSLIVPIFIDLIFADHFEKLNQD